MLTKYTNSKPYLLLTFTGDYDRFGFKVFNLNFVNSKNEAVDKLKVISGAAYAQRRELPHPKDDFSGSGNPIPEGIYKVGGIVRMSFAEKGVGCVKIALDVLLEFRVNNRSEFLLHSDFNKEVARGSLGCIVTYNEKDMDRIVSWCSQRNRPDVLVVDYKRGFLVAKGIEIAI